MALSVGLLSLGRRFRGVVFSFEVQRLSHKASQPNAPNPKSLLSSAVIRNFKLTKQSKQ